MAHRLKARTRVKDGERCLILLQTLLSKGTPPNLWDAHHPLQIDGNFGRTSGIAVILLQSHESAASPAPQVSGLSLHVPIIHLPHELPEAWSPESTYGLHARGGFIIDQGRRSGRLVRAKITSQLGQPYRIRYGNELKPRKLARCASRIFTLAS